MRCARSRPRWLLLAALLGPVAGVLSESGPVVDPARPAWLVRADGSPFFLCGAGDPEDFLYRGAREADGTRNGDQLELIRKLAPTGANAIYFAAVRSHGGDGDGSQNPFVDSDPARGLDPELLLQWERWFSEMDAAGIVAFFVLYDDGARLWDTGDRVGGEERAFVLELARRFGHHEHWIWVVAEEYDEAYSRARVAALAATLRAADPSAHAIAVHQRHGLEFDFADDANVDQFALQYNVATPREIHAGVVHAFRRAAGRYNLNLAEVRDHGRGAGARRRSWAAALGGAYVMVLGMDIASSDVRDLEDCGRLRRFMEASDFAELAPADELALAGTEYVLAKPGERYIAYAARRSPEIGLRGLAAGSYELIWFDPASGERVAEQRALPPGDARFARPPAFGEEVALYLRRISSP